MTRYHSYILDELAHVPADQLPDDARDALAEAIRTGEVDALYTPLGSTEYNVCLADLPLEIDPRVKLSQWVEWWQAAQSATAEVIRAFTEQQQRIWNEERARLQDGGQPR